MVWLLVGGNLWEMFVPVRSDTWLFGSTRNTGGFDILQSRNKGILLLKCWLALRLLGRVTACRSMLKLGDQYIDVHLGAICLLATNTTFPPPEIFPRRNKDLRYRVAGEARERRLPPCWERRRATGKYTERKISRAVSYITRLSVDNLSRSERRTNSQYEDW